MYLNSNLGELEPGVHGMVYLKSKRAQSPDMENKVINNCQVLEEWVGNNY